MNSSFRIIDPFLTRPPVVAFDDLPEEMKSLAGEISQREDQRTAVRYAYEALAKKYRGFRIYTFIRLDRFFITDLATLWKISGFLHCNHLNYLLRTLLIASKQFIPENVEAHWTQIWFFSPHQYLVFHLKNGESLNVDLWGKVYGIPFGTYAHGFQVGNSVASRRE
ncbi:MAG: hypothetical protein Q8Q10_04850 [bacterium]|nr:hypothetical protein [bacterium]